jgi:hypothetical protein
VLGALLLAAACGSSDSSGAPDVRPATEEPSTTPAPSGTTRPPGSAAPPTGAAAAVADLMRALDDGDCRTAKRLVVTPSELGCDVVEQAAGSFADEGIDLDAVSYRAGAVRGGSSTVTIRWGNGYPAESYEAQRVGGRWKVVFDSAA